MTEHFEMDITERGKARLYWDDSIIWEGPVSALQELERMIAAFSFHHEFSPSLRLHLSVLEAPDDPR